MKLYLKLGSFIVICSVLASLPAVCQHGENISKFFEPDTLPRGKGKVHTVTRFLNDRETLIKQSQYSYDQQGRKIQEITFFDATGRPRLVKDFTYKSNGVVQCYAHYEFVSDLHVESGSASPLEYIWKKSEFAPLDSGKQRISIITLPLKAKIPDTTILVLNNKNQQIYVEEHSNGHFKSSTTFYRDERGKMVANMLKEGTNFSWTTYYDSLGREFKRRICRSDSCNDITFHYDSEGKASGRSVVENNSVEEKFEILRDRGQVKEVRQWEMNYRTNELEVYWKQVFVYDPRSNKLQDDYKIRYDGDTLFWNHYVYGSDGTLQHYTIDYDGLYDFIIDRNDYQWQGDNVTVTSYDGVYEQFSDKPVGYYLGIQHHFIPFRSIVTDTVKDIKMVEIRYSKGRKYKFDSLFYDENNRLVTERTYFFKMGTDSLAMTRSREYRYDQSGNISEINAAGIGHLDYTSHALYNDAGVLLFYDSINKGVVVRRFTTKYDSLNRLIEIRRYSYHNPKVWEESLEETTYDWGDYISECRGYNILADGTKQLNYTYKCLFKNGLPEKYESIDRTGKGRILAAWSYTYY